MNKAELEIIYSELVALKSHLPEGLTVHEKYAQEFEETLDQLEKASGMEFARFRIPSLEFGPKALSRNLLEGTTTYAKGRYCDRSFLEMRIDKVLGFLKLQLQSTKPTLGFAQSHAR